MISTSLGAAPLAPKATWVHNTTEDNEAIITQPQDGVSVVASGTYNGLGKLEGLDASSGNVRWTADNAFYPNIAPTQGADGNLYSQSYDGNSILVRNPATGQVLRQMPEALAMYSAVTQGQSGNVYVGAATEASQGIYAFGQDGATRWQYPMRYMSGIAPVEVGGSVFCEDDSRLYALDPQSGKVQWAFAAETGVTQAPMAGPDGTLYVIDHNDTVYAIDPKKGTALWTNHLDMPIQNPDGVNNLDVSQPLVLSNNGLTVVCTNQAVRQLDAGPGQQKWEVKEPVDGPAVAGPSGAVYVGDGEGILRLDSGTGQSARWDAGDEMTAPQAGPPATTVVQFGVGKVAGFQE